jgi:tRNA modification GTPase
LKGVGLEALQEAIIRVAEAFHVETGDELIAINARHAHALEQAQIALASAKVKIATKDPSELVASDLRNAIFAFGEIAGRIDNERVLDQLFANFCIGK